MNTNVIIKGAMRGVIVQFIADVVITLYLNGLQIIFTDIKISDASAYGAAVATGITSSFCAQHMDTFAVNVLSTIVYTYTFNLFNYLENNEEIDFSTQEMVFDIGVAILITFAFDPIAYDNYNLFRLKKMGYNVNTKIDTPASIFLFLLILSDTYIALKTASRLNE